MADLKISQLTGATTPLAGTEVLPIVQGGSTVKVAVSNLTAGRNVATGALSATGLISTTKVGLAFTAVSSTTGIAYANLANTNGNFIFGCDNSTGNALFSGSTGYASFAGSLTNKPFYLLSDNTPVVKVTSTDVTFTASNLVIGTSGKGIDFSATAGTGTSELLADYEEGTFTPTVIYSGTNTPTYLAQLGRYTKVGRTVQVQIYLGWNENGSTGDVTVGSLPFTSVTSNARAVASILSFGLLVTTLSITGFVNTNATTITLFLNDNAGTVVSATNTDNDQDVYVTVTYEAA